MLSANQKKIVAILYESGPRDWYGISKLYRAKYKSVPDGSVMGLMVRFGIVIMDDNRDFYLTRKGFAAAKDESVSLEYIGGKWSVKGENGQWSGFSTGVVDP